jgi:hypothetical protein
VTDPYLAAQRAAEDHLDACFEYIDIMESPNEPDDERYDVPEDPASAPFCGCNTCIVRETLLAAREHLLRTLPSAQLPELARMFAPGSTQDRAHTAPPEEGR